MSVSDLGEGCGDHRDTYPGTEEPPQCSLCGLRHSPHVRHWDAMRRTLTEQDDAIAQLRKDLANEHRECVIATLKLSELQTRASDLTSALAAAAVNWVPPASWSWTTYEAFQSRARGLLAGVRMICPSASCGKVCGEKAVYDPCEERRGYWSLRRDDCPAAVMVTREEAPGERVL